MKTFAISTLGCKVNQYESSYIKESLENLGLINVSFSSCADIYIINTCTVTSKASFQSRQLLRRAKKLNPHAVIAAVGCYSQIETINLSRLAIATHILGTREKIDIAKFLSKPGSFLNPFVKVSKISACSFFRPQPIHEFEGHTRAFLKIQDGCSAFCTYCIVPYSRGPSRSLLPHEITEQIGRFLNHGYREIVFTGVHLGKWGNDLHPSTCLSKLLDNIGQKFGNCRFRLSSIEPLELKDELLKMVARYPQFCPHLHVPLQSGNISILERMHRPYTPEDYEERFWKAYDLIPDLAWGADVIVGFPGETEEGFLKTLEFIKKLPLAYLHVFPFSPRPGTPAATFPRQVDGKEKKRRTGLLRKLGEKKRKKFYSRFIGRKLEILVESRNKVDGRFYQGFSPNYLRVLIPGSSSLVNKNITVRIKKFSGTVLLAVPA